MGKTTTRLSAWALALLGFAWLATAAVAAEPGIKDDGRFFSDTAVAKTNQQLQSLKTQANRTVVIETTADLPAELQGQVDGNDFSKSQAYKAYAQQRAYSTGADVYLLINRTPPHIEPYRRDAARSGISQSQLDTLVKGLAARFRAKDFDGGLAGFVASVDGKASPNTSNGTPATPVPAQGYPSEQTRRQADSNAPVGYGSGSNRKDGGIGSYLCLGVVGLILLFVVIAVIKRIAGGARQGPPPLNRGYGQPGYDNYGPGAYGNQGGGFGRGLGGGILGGLLGSWIGSNVFGQSHGGHADAGQSGNDGNAWGGPVDTGGSSGADFGDTSSSSDFSGGSDFSSGSDFGGGGDSGGSSGSDF
ncbi:MAG: TPM domain-containing protein [Tepidisphaeraceae bacterium]